MSDEMVNPSDSKKQSEREEAARRKLDLSENASDSQVRQWYKKLMFQINEIDDVLDAQADIATGGKRKFTSELVTNTESSWKPVVDSLSKDLTGMESEKRAGSFYGLLRALQDEFKEEIDEWIEQQLATRPKDENPKIEEEKKKELQNARADLAKQVKTIVEMAYTFGEAHGNQNDESFDTQWPPPKTRRGSVGARGKRALTLFTSAINGEDVDEDNDSVKGVSSLLGFERSADFTKALRDAGIDTTNPGDGFTIEVNGKTVVGKRLTDEDLTEPNGDDSVE